MADPFENHQPGLITPPEHAVAVTPSDTVDLDNIARAIYVGTPGNVAVITSGGDTVTYVNVAGRLSGRFSRILLTGTTAADIIAEY